MDSGGVCAWLPRDHQSNLSFWDLHCSSALPDGWWELGSTAVVLVHRHFNSGAAWQWRDGIWSWCAVVTEDHELPWRSPWTTHLLSFFCSLDICTIGASTSSPSRVSSRWTLSVDNTKGKQVISSLVVRRVRPVLKVFTSILFWVIIITIHASHCGVGPTRCLFLMAAMLRKVLVHLCVRTWCHATENDLDLAHTHTQYTYLMLPYWKFFVQVHIYLALRYWKDACTRTWCCATENSCALVRILHATLLKVHLLSMHRSVLASVEVSANKYFSDLPIWS